ncbi:hypothetical protein RI367_008423 [Sorochytrium milnesiophthora]
MANSILLVLALFACSAQMTLALSAQESCVATFNPSTDCFSYKSNVSTSTLWSVEYHNYYKLLKIPSLAATYALVLRGAPHTNVPASVNATFDVPVHKSAFMDTTSLAFLEMIGERSNIAVGDTSMAVSSPCAQKMIKESKIMSVDATNATKAAAQYTQADAIFSGVGPAADGSNADKIVQQSATTDPGPLNRAEWIKFFAHFFNTEDAADATFTDLTNRYNAGKAAAKRAAPATPLSVAWVSYSSPASWNNNTATWSISSAPYKKAFVEDAQGTFFVPASAAASSFTDKSAFVDQIKNVDVLVDESFAGTDLPSLVKTWGIDANAVKAVKNNNVYRVDARVNPNGGLDWFESAVVQPSQVLTDLMTVLVPSAVPKDSAKRVYLRNMSSEQATTLTDAQCTGDELAPEAVSGPTVELFNSAAAAPAGGAPAKGTSAGAQAATVSVSLAFGAAALVLMM